MPFLKDFGTILLAKDSIYRTIQERMEELGNWMCECSIPRAVNKLEFRLRQSPGVRRSQRGPYCINTDLFAIDRTAGAYRLSPNSNFLTARGIEDLAILKIEGCTPYPEVKTILLSRFHRRLEAGQPATVPGRTLETVVEMCPPSPP